MLIFQKSQPNLQIRLLVRHNKVTKHFAHAKLTKLTIILH